MLRLLVVLGGQVVVAAREGGAYPPAPDDEGDGQGADAQADAAAYDADVGDAHGGLPGGDGKGASEAEGVSQEGDDDE